MRLVNPPRSFRVVAGAAVLSALGACATLAEPAVPGYGDSMATAQSYVEAGQPREAMAALERAAAMQPASKEPWLEIARLRAAQGRHVDALAAAEQVLRRDPADPAAHEITIGSGLQVALQTMKRLRASGQDPGEERSEQAGAIAVLMAEVFGPEFLVPADVKARLAQQAVETYKATRTERLPEAQEKPKGDPLDLLGGD